MTTQQRSVATKKDATVANDEKKASSKGRKNRNGNPNPKKKQIKKRQAPPVSTHIHHTIGGVRVEKTAVISLEENVVYRVKERQIEKVDKDGKGFGKQIITWQDDKPLFYEGVSYTKR